MRAQFNDMLVGAARRYGIAVAVVALALALSLLLAALIGEASLHGILLSAVVIGAWYGGRGPGIVATIVVALAGSAQMFPSIWLPSIADTGDWFQLGMFLGEGVILSALIGALRTRLHNAETALRARDNLLAIAAHEFKTPLTTVIGCTQTLQIRAAREGYLPKRDQDALRVIAGQAKRLHALIDSVLNLARLHNGQAQIARQMVDLAGLARRVVDDAGLMETGHILEFRGPDTPVVITGDRVRLEQVLQNLLDNAVKYSPAGGVITVGVERRNVQAVLSVSDQGIGIPEEARARLFDRFYRASNIDRRQTQGVGIGLSIVIEIVALHGGVVEIDSAEGRGSTFTVRLPLSEAHIATRAANSIDHAPSISPALTTRQGERPVRERYHEHVH